LAVPSRRAEQIRRMKENRKAFQREVSKGEGQRIKENERPLTEEESKKRLEKLRNMGIIK